MSSHASSTQDHASIESALDGKARIARLFEMTSDLLAINTANGSTLTIGSSVALL